MTGNSTTIRKNNLESGERYCPRVSPISAGELEILEELDPDRETLGAILTTKAVFNGTICRAEG